MVDVEARLAAVLGAWPAVRAAWLFGTVARGEAGPLSDVDVAVLGAASLDFDARAALASELSTAAGRRCDLVCVESASPVLGMEIVRAGRRLVARDPGAADAWEDRALVRYLGTAHLRRMVSDEVRDGLLSRPGGPR